MEDFDSCPPCWAAKRECVRRPIGCCRRCSSYIRHGVNDSQSTIKCAQPLYTTPLCKQLYNGAPMRSLASIDSQGADLNILTLRISTSAKSTNTIVLHISGPFTPQNREVVEALDRFIQENFSAKLDAKDGETTYIADAALIGGYLYLLCSSRGASEYATTTQDGFPIGNQYTGYNLDAHFKYFLVCRIRELVNTVLDAIRFEDQLKQYPHLCSNAYAAAVIAEKEINQFRSSLRNGWLKPCIAPALKSILFNWFNPVLKELQERIHEGCGRFPNWRAPIEGSMKKLRRHAETFTAVMALDIRAHTFQQLPSFGFDTYPYADLGHGDDMLIDPVISVPPLQLDYPFQPFSLEQEDTNDLDPPHQLILRHPQQPIFPVDYHAPTTTVPAPSSQTPLYARSYDFDPKMGQADITASLDPRYLSIPDWYSGHNNV